MIMGDQIHSTEWVATGADDVIQFQTHHELFISVFNASVNLGCGIKLPLGALTSAKLTSLFEKAAEIVTAAVTDCEVKVVGQPTLVAEAQEILASLSIKPRSSVSRESPSLIILFYPLTGRVRVAADEAGPSAITSRIGTRNSVGSIVRKIRVLIVDDSPTIRKLLSHVILRDSAIEVVAAAELPSQVEALIIQHKPDVITLDIHMPEMDGVTLLKKIHPKYMIPTVMITSISKDEGPMVLDALESGAVDYIQKPSMESLDATVPIILEKIKIAAQVKLKATRAKKASSTPRLLSKNPLDQNRLVAIGSSTGGTEALREVLTRLPEQIPAVLIVQHIPAVFSLAFATRMNQLCPFEVKEAEDGDEVRKGRVLIAPGGKQMKLVGKPGAYKVMIDDSPPVNRHKPSVDFLFDSVAQLTKNHSIGVILTGMGADGAKGMLAMRKAGARTIAQDEASCVVFGMPKEAINLGGAEKVCDLLEIPEMIIEFLQNEEQVA